MPGDGKPDEGSQSGTSGGNGGGTVRTETVYVDADVERIAAKYGGKDQAIRRLFRDGKKARDERRAAEERADKAVEDAKPKAGEIRLTGDQAKAWESYQKLGKPEEIEPKLKEHGTLSESVKKTEGRKLIDTAAKAAGYQNADALADLVDTKKIAVVLRTEKVNDKDVEVPYVQPAGENAAPVKLTEYVDKNLALYKPALLAPSAGGGQNGASGAADSARRTPHPEQGTGSSSSGNGKPAGSAIPLRETRVLPSQRNGTTT